MKPHRVGVLGASSMVADSLIPKLAKSYAVLSFSRQTMVARPDSCGDHVRPHQIPYWVSLVPIWVLPDYFPMLSRYGAQRVVALSSTSVFTKQSSSDSAERTMAVRLGEGEQRLIAWATSESVQWLILRPTLIYGRGKDGNIAEIARFIRSFGFFPVFGAADGLRQPLHVDDVASACQLALEIEAVANRAYDISGSETLRYCDMVARVFEALDMPPRCIRLPLWSFRIGAVCVRLLSRSRRYSASMAERMNQDLTIDPRLAISDLGFKPRAFELDLGDLPD